MSGRRAHCQWHGQNNIIIKKASKAAGPSGDSSLTQPPCSCQCCPRAWQGLIATKWIPPQVSRPKVSVLEQKREFQKEFLTVQAAGKQLCQGGWAGRCPGAAACPGGQGRGILGCTWEGTNGGSGRGSCPCPALG